MDASRPRGLPWRLGLLCLAVAAALQAPLAWAWTLLYRPSSYAENSVTLYAPFGTATEVAAIHISNNHYPGARWLEVTMWPAAAAYDRSGDVRSNPGEPYDSNPAHPWPLARVVPSATDDKLWPARMGVLHRPGSQSGITVSSLEMQGWPFPCVQGRTDYDLAAGHFVRRGQLHTQVGATRAWPRGPWIPLAYIPVWPGFALNTLILASLLLVLWITPGAVRRRLRRRAGCCRRCGYDLRGLPGAGPCPECGEMAAAGVRPESPRQSPTPPAPSLRQ